MKNARGDGQRVWPSQLKCKTTPTSTQPQSLSGENCQLVTDKPVEFEKQPIEVGDFRRITDQLEESIEYMSK